jgi:hypothetical protein
MVAAVVVLLTCGAITGLLWWVNASGLTGAELTTARIEAIKIGLSIAVGGGGVFALYLARRRQRSNEADHQQRERVLEHQRQVAPTLVAVNGQLPTGSTTQPGSVDAGKTSVETALDPASQVQARLDDAAKSIMWARISDSSP